MRQGQGRLHYYLMADRPGMRNNFTGLQSIYKWEIDQLEMIELRIQFILRLTANERAFYSTIPSYF